MTSFDYFWSIWTDIWPFDPFNSVFTYKKYIWSDPVVRVGSVERKFLSYLTPISKYDVILWPYIRSNWPKIVKGTSFWPQNGVICQNWGEISQKMFLNIIYFYYWVTSWILFVGKNKVNRVKRPYTCSNWPKIVKKTSFWPQYDIIRRNWGEIWQKNFQHYLLLLLSHLVYTFLVRKLS